MTINLYDVFAIKEKDGVKYLDLSDDFKHLSKGLCKALNTWNDVQCRNEAQLYAEKYTCEELREMIEVLTNVVNKAEENASQY